MIGCRQNDWQRSGDRAAIGCNRLRLLLSRLALGHRRVEQPRQLSAFCANREPGAFVDPTGISLQSAHELLREVRSSVLAIDAKSDALTRQRTLSLQGGITLELSGSDYLDEFLIPNFYFHLVTAYDILRHAGVPLGKGDYMAHLAPLVRRPG